MASPLPRTSATMSALTALALLATGCFAEGGTEDDTHLRVSLAFPPVQQMSPYSDDALLLGRVGAAEPLTRVSDGGELEPLLALDWEQTEDTVWTLRLRDDVDFHDGTPLDADHVAEALNHATGASPKPRALAGVDIEAEPDGEDTVSITTDPADPILPQRLSSPELAILGPTAYEDDPAVPDPVGAGTGPFELVDVDRGSAELTAHEDYWAGTPAADGVDVSFVENDATRVGGLRTGEVDIVDAVPIAEVDNISGGHLVEVSTPRTVGLMLNSEDGPFTDPALRASAVSAVDTGPIVEGVYEGRADEVGGLFGPVSEWAEDRPAPDIQGADDADGETVSLATYSDRPELAEAASAVAEDLRAVGFEVDVTVQEFATMETDLLEGAYDAVIGTRSYLVETNDPVGYLASDWSCGGSYNLARFCDEEIDGMIADASGEVDLDDRLAAAVEVETAVLDTHTFVPLAGERARVGVVDGVDGVAEDPLERAIITWETQRQ